MKTLILIMLCAFALEGAGSAEARRPDSPNLVPALRTVAVQAPAPGGGKGETAPVQVRQPATLSPTDVLRELREFTQAPAMVGAFYLGLAFMVLPLVRRLVSWACRENPATNDPEGPEDENHNSI